MHTYLESIGFRQITGHREMERLTKDVVLHYDAKALFKNDHGRICGEYSRDYAPDMGLTVVGEYDESGDFHPEYSFPYFNGATVSLQTEVDFERHAGEESFAGACEDPRIGATIIFYLNNMGQYRRRYQKDPLFPEPLPVKLSALAKEGSVLLPVYHTPRDDEQLMRKREAQLRMITEARGGDEEAIEALTEEDMKDYSIITKRLQYEDVLSIIDTCFLPYGIECDQYGIVGNIVSCERVRNLYTSEYVWQMQVETCDVYLDVCINESRLVGEPRAGRRFRGLIWLQGVVHFG